MGVADAVAHERLAALAADCGAGLAHLQLGEPSLRAELDRLAADGVDEITLVGVTAGGDPPGNSWLRRVAAHWWRAQQEPPTVWVGTHVIAGAAELSDALRRARPITGAEPPLTSAAWEEVPGHRHQVFVCRGPRCTAQGADRTAAELGHRLAVEGLGDDDVLVTQTGCQFPCNHAPVVTVHPDDVWYGGVDEEAARRIVEEHLVAGRVVAEHRLARGRSRDE
ncbi:MAG: (2Fe-2S) ferredoxin domain-containing protein [Nocardioides sp.]|uniref:(2Fe-2S) ferredoxin domain-containing protein n=1 Tax=Nocardioides sp. TaxID=35761 RepID=UPI0039E29B56